MTHGEMRPTRRFRSIQMASASRMSDIGNRIHRPVLQQRVRADHRDLNRICEQ